MSGINPVANKSLGTIEPKAQKAVLPALWQHSFLGFGFDYGSPTYQRKLNEGSLEEWHRQGVNRRTLSNCWAGILRFQVGTFPERITSQISRLVFYAGKVIGARQNVKHCNVPVWAWFMAKISFPRTLSALAIATGLLVSSASALLAQGLPGLVIFSGVERDNILGYRLDFDGVPRRRDRYRLRISGQKLPIAVSQLTVTYPENYDGTFDLEDVELRVAGDEVDISEVRWNEEIQEINIYPVASIPANSRVEIILSNVRNPQRAGLYYFNALVLPTGDIPLRRYVGTWIIGIGDN